MMRLQGQTWSSVQSSAKVPMTQCTSGRPVPMTPGSRVFHRITTMGDHRHRIEFGEDPTQAQGEAELETLGGAIARRMLEGHVELHLGRGVEKAEEPVADRARLVELVEPDAGPGVGRLCPRRGYDMHDQRSLLLTEMRRHLRASSRGSDPMATAP